MKALIELIELEIVPMIEDNELRGDGLTGVEIRAFLSATLS
jgi:hypothetical protein